MGRTLRLIRKVLNKVRNGSQQSDTLNVYTSNEAADRMYVAQSVTVWDDGDGNVLRLETATEHHIPFLMSCNSDVDGYRMIGYSHRVWPEKFKQEIYGWNLFQIITSNDIPVGFIKATVKIEDRAGYVSMYLVPKARSQGLLQLVVHPFLSTLFESLSLHKVQVGVWAFNQASLNNFKKFPIEYVSKDDTYYRGRYWDKYVYCVLEDEWPDFKLKLEKDEARAKSILKKRNQRLRNRDCTVASSQL